MSAEDRYDSRGRVLDGPDDPCCHHGNDPDACAECRADFEREMAEHKAWEAEHPRASIQTPYPPDFNDLPY